MVICLRLVSVSFFSSSLFLLSWCLIFLVLILRLVGSKYFWKFVGFWKDPRRSYLLLWVLR